jgi:hypothetical protein
MIDFAEITSVFAPHSACISNNLKTDRFHFTSLFERGFPEKFKIPYATPFFKTIDRELSSLLK